MRVTEVVPASGQVHDVSVGAGRDWLTEQYRPSPEVRVRMNMITGLTGAAAGGDGTSNTLTNAVDRLILRAIRATADVVVVGAQSVRAEAYIVPRSTRLAIVSASGDLTGHRLTHADPNGVAPVLLLCPADRADSLAQSPLPAGVRLVPVPGVGRITPRAIVATLAELGLRTVVCEGGPSVAAQFAEAGVIDEYCVTVAPSIMPAGQPFLPVRTAQSTRVAGALADEDGFSYLRLCSLR